MKFLYALLYIAALGILSHFVGQALPRAWFSAERFPYRAAEWEKGGKVYEKLGIKRWKDFLPDMSRIMPDMVKKKMTKQSREQGMGVLIAETCVAECVHFWLIVLGNVPFMIIQRYNRPRLVLLEQRRKRRATAQ